MHVSCDARLLVLLPHCVSHSWGNTSLGTIHCCGYASKLPCRNAGTRPYSSEKQGSPRLHQTGKRTTANAVRTIRTRKGASAEVMDNVHD